MATRILPTPEQLRQLLRYEPETGKLFWSPRPIEMFATKRAYGAWHSNFCDKEAFAAPHSKGYRFGTLLGRCFLAHRVIWAMYYGEWPKEEIDHINCNKEDNRISNLRSASRLQNMRNVRVKSSNRCGFKGVTFHAETGKWRARINQSRTSISLGLFDTPEAAHSAYCLAAEKQNGEFARS